MIVAIDWSTPTAAASILRSPSQAVMAGKNLPLVGKLLGHRRHRTTAGYAHLDDAHLVEAAERVGSTIADAMEFEVRLR